MFLTCYRTNGNHSEKYASLHTSNPLFIQIVHLHMHDRRHRQWNLSGGHPTAGETKCVFLVGMYRI